MEMVRRGQLLELYKAGVTGYAEGLVEGGEGREESGRTPRLGEAATDHCLPHESDFFPPSVLSSLQAPAITGPLPSRFVLA
jgi:hypothetical protein